MSNKQQELKCLNDAVECLSNQKGFSKLLSTVLKESETNEFEYERPDFVCSCSCDSKVVLGIEHFSVDMLSQKKGSKVVSYTKKQRDDSRTLYEKRHPEVISNDSISQSAVEDLSSLIAERLTLEAKASYNTFLASFNYSLGKHVLKVDEYLNNLAKYKKEGREVKLGFLIEIQTSFHEIILDNSGIINNGIPPLFDDIVSILKEIDSDKVDFFILYFRSSRNDEVKAVAFRSGNRIDSDLNDQSIDVFAYVGEDRWFSMGKCIDTKCKTNVTADDKEFKIVFNLSYRTISDEMKASLIWHSVYAIQFCKRHGIRYVTTKIPFEIEKYFGPFICSWIIDKDRFASPVFNPCRMNEMFRAISKFINATEGEE